MKVANKEELREEIVTLRNKLKAAEFELEAFKNQKNWTRPYNCNGELINEVALFRPKLKSVK